MENKFAIKPMIEASILTSIFIVLTLVSNMVGVGFLGYYDFFVPIFFTLVFIRSGSKYGFLSIISSTVIIFIILGNPITSLMILQGAILGMVNGYLILRFKSIGDELILISICSLLVLFIFDFILRTFTNISLVSSFGEFSKDFSQIIDNAIKTLSGNNKAIEVLVSYKKLIGSNMMKQSFYFSFALMSLGSGFIIYFLSLIVLKKFKIEVPNNQCKIRLIGSFKKNIRFIFASKKVFVFMIIYVLIAEIIKILKFESSIEYVNSAIFSLEYLFTIFTFKDAMIIMENKMIAESGSIKPVRRYRILVIIMLLFNVKLMYIAVIVNYIINDRNGKYRECFESALKNNIMF